MDLKIKDVAELLNISEETVKRWITERHLPSYHINDEHLFNTAEIEDWVLEQKLGVDLENEPHPHHGNLQFSLYRSLYRGEVLTNVPGTTKEEVIAHTMNHMAKRFSLDAHVLTDLFLDREKMMSTALGHGVAVPHTRDFLLDTHYDVILTVYPEQPLDFRALDGEPVHTLFFLFASEDRHHLNLLAKVAHVNATEEGRHFFRSRPSKEKVLTFVKNWEGSLKG